MNKFQITIDFEMDEKFMTLIPKHREYINKLIEKGTIDSYSVSLESMKCWIVIIALSKDAVKRILSKSPLYSYWTYTIDSIYVFDGQSVRLPGFQLN